MAPPPAAVLSTTLAQRFTAFVAERHPFALAPAIEAFSLACPKDPGRDSAAIDALRQPFGRELARLLAGAPPAGLPETTPGVSVEERLVSAKRELAEACDRLPAPGVDRGFADQGRTDRDPRGMILTRATDNRLKAFFSGSEVRYKDVPFQGKGFRSLGQEAIYAAPLRLKRGPGFRASDGSWRGDVVAPLIRDLGAALAMRPEGDTVRMVLAAQMGKAGPPMDGKDLHVGDFEWGVLPASAPLAISSLYRGRHGDGVRAGRLAPRDCFLHRRRRHVARASGTRRSTSAPLGGFRLSSASRTTRRRSRLRLPNSLRRACSPRRRPATACPASRSTARIPRRSRRPSPGRPSGPGRATVRP